MSNLTKREVFNLVTKATENFCLTQKLDLNAMTVSKKINISRSLASQYLNDYYNSGDFIKIITRPVYYLERKTLEKYFKMEIIDSDFYDIKELISNVEQNILLQKNFMKAIGNDTSLSHCVLQLQSAVKYPPNGLPVLLQGEHGVGKTFMSNLMYDYAIEEKIITKDSNILFYNASDFDRSNEKDIDKIFGKVIKNSDESLHLKEGLLLKTNGGIIVIENIELLSYKCYDLLIDYMRLGEFYIDGTDALYKSTTRIVMTTSVNPKENITSSFLQNIPIICNLPSLEKRPQEDKIAFIVEFLKRESENLQKEVMISNRAFNLLIDSNYKNNIKELSNVIKISCAKAYYENDKQKNRIDIYLHHLPVELLNNSAMDEDQKSVDTMINVNDFTLQTVNNALLGFFNYALNVFEEYQKQTIDKEQFLEKCFEGMNMYYDFIVFEKQYSNSRIKIYEMTLTNIFERILNKYDVYISSNCAFIIARVIYSYMQSFSSIKTWGIQNKNKIVQMLRRLEQLFPIEYSVMLDVRMKIKKQLEVDLDEMNMMFLLLNIHFYNRDMNKSKYDCVVITHGYSTATSIADTVNRLMGFHIMDGIDMPLDTNVDDIVVTLKKHVINHITKKDLILLVDMGSLQNIGSKLSEIANINIGVLNNVSTGIALSVATKINQSLDMKDILESTCKDKSFKYQIIKNSIKKKAIIFTSEIGVAASERAMELFKKSLPSPIDVHIFSYDYIVLSKNLDDDDVFKKFDVMFIVGTVYLDLKKTPFIPLENIIAFNEVDKIILALKNYFTDQEIDLFYKNLIRNFNLENVMNYITILNAEQLITYIENSLNLLQNFLSISISMKTQVGLYLHISCLIEKLIIQNDTVVDKKPKVFSKEHVQFFKVFDESFKSIIEHYRIVIPYEEKKYLYEYIFNAAN